MINFAANYTMKDKIAFLLSLFACIMFLAGCGDRMPSITLVRADYENGILSVNIKNYIGMVLVYIYDADKIT